MGTGHRFNVGDTVISTGAFECTTSTMVIAKLLDDGYYQVRVVRLNRTVKISDEDVDLYELQT